MKIQIIRSIRCPDHAGQWDDVVLGFDTVQEYEEKCAPYFGALIGRVCNRIADVSRIECFELVLNRESNPVVMGAPFQLQWAFV